MSNWIDVAMLVISCVLINHMGLIDSVEKIIKHEIPILNCIKCLTFWIVLIYLILNGFNVVISVATSFLLSYVAIWLEFLFGLIDILYENTYKRIYKDSTNTEKTDTDNSNTEESES